MGRKESKKLEENLLEWQTYATQLKSEVESKTSYISSLKETNNRLENSLKKQIKNLQGEKITLNEKLVQSEDKITQLRQELIQQKDNFNKLTEANKDLQQSNEKMDYNLKVTKGKIYKLPNHLGLIHNHIRDKEDGITISELKREIKKSRSVIYKAVNYLVDRNNIVKMGTRYVDKESYYAKRVRVSRY